MKSEADLGKIVVQYLRDLGWEVYQEVSWGQGGNKRADIVAVQDRVIWILELKKTFGFDVLAQAEEWIHWNCAHKVSVVTPEPKKGRVKAYGFRKKMAEHIGAGWLQVRNGRWGQPDFVSTEATPRIQRRLRDDHLGTFIREEHKTALEAGSQGGGYWTPFRGTALAVQETVRTCPGITLKELIEKVDHHYRSDAGARSSIRKWVSQGVIEGVEFRKEGRKLTLHPKSLLSQSETPSPV